jgi:hypothetical protein
VPRNIANNNNNNNTGSSPGEIGIIEADNPEQSPVVQLNS